MILEIKNIMSIYQELRWLTTDHFNDIPERLERYVKKPIDRKWPKISQNFPKSENCLKMA